MRRARAAIGCGLAACLTAALAACSSGTTPGPSRPSGSGSVTVSTAVSPTGPAGTAATGPTDASHSGRVPAAADATIASMLAMVPNTQDTQTFAVVNLYWKAARAGDIAVPGADAPADARMRYAADLTSRVDAGIGVAGSTLTSQLVMSRMSQASRPAGEPFTLPDVSADVQAGEPPTSALAARGRFDRREIDKQFRGDATWQDELTTPSYHGHTFYRWLDDLKMDPSKRNTGLFTDLGQSRRMAFPDSSTFLFGRVDATMHALLDIADGDRGSLDDDADHHDVAAALDEHDVYSAMITGPQPAGPILPDMTASPSQARSAMAEARKHALKPYLLAGIGETIEDGEPGTVIVLANADAADAKANVAALRTMITSGMSLRTHKPWSTYFGIDSIGADGRLTVAVLRPKTPRAVMVWQDVVGSGDTLLSTG